MAAEQQDDRASLTEVDFRSSRSETSEGRGLARARLDAHLGDPDVELDPDDHVASLATEPVLSEELLGFWLLWHMVGGFEAVESFGMHRSTIWRKVRRFRCATGVHPDEFTFVGIEVTPESLWCWRYQARAWTEREGGTAESDI